MGWAHVDVVLTTGGASRMPMIRDRLKTLSGTTLNTSLSPDLSIAHGATYYAGMLLSNDKFARSILSAEASSRLSQVKQRSVNARGLGILVRDDQAGGRIPHYLIPANTALPAKATQNFGTVIDGQKRVRLVVVESGADPQAPCQRLGDCVIENLPPDLPSGSKVAVTIRYDEQAKVHVSARDLTSEKIAEAEIIRAENLKPQLTTDQRSDRESEVDIVDAPPEPARQSPNKHADRRGTNGGRPTVSGRSPTPARRRESAKTAQDSQDTGEQEFWRLLE